MQIKKLHRYSTSEPKLVCNHGINCPRNTKCTRAIFNIHWYVIKLRRIFSAQQIKHNEVANTNNSWKNFRQKRLKSIGDFIRMILLASSPKEKSAAEAKKTQAPPTEIQDKTEPKLLLKDKTRTIFLLTLNTVLILGTFDSPYQRAHFKTVFAGLKNKHYEQRWGEKTTKHYP